MLIETKLLQLFDALEEGSIRYSLLRGFDELGEAAHTKEIDLLVKRSDLAGFAKISATLGFIELPRWGYEPHYFFVAYDAEADTWLKLDVVTELIYGKPVRWLKVALADRCLAQRCKAEPAYALSPADEFVTLFFHCLLDKGFFRPERRERLLALKDQAEKNPEMKQRILENFEIYLPAGVSYESILELIVRDDQAALADRSPGLGRRLDVRALLQSL